MAPLRRFLLRLFEMLRPARREPDLAREIAAHLRQLEEEYERRGSTPREARRLARSALGGIEQTKELHRQARSFRWLTDLGNDLARASRTLTTTAGFLVAVASLALAIGSTTAVYSTLDWLLNRSSGGVHEPERLVILRVSDRNHPELRELSFSYQQYEDLRKVQDAFVDIAAFGRLVGVLGDDTRTDPVIYELATGNYFNLLGVRPLVGRTLGPDDGRPGADPVVVLSYAFWQQRFGGDAAVVGRDIRLEGRRCRVVGVLPRGFEGYHLDWNGPADIWVPLHAVTALGRPAGFLQRNIFFPIVARLQPGVSLIEGRERAQRWLPSLRAAVPVGPFRPTTITVAPSTERRIRRHEDPQRFLGVLLVVCALILLATCANVANVLLERSVSRRGEFALRAALGAGRGRIMRLVLAESLLVGIGASVLGLLVAVALAHALATASRLYLPQVVATSAVNTAAAIDLRMAAVSVALGIGSALLFGALPALTISSRDPLGDLKNPRPSWSWGGARLTLGQAVLVLQVALAVTIAVPAGLYARSLFNLWHADSEYQRPESVLVARLVRASTVGPEDQFYPQVLARVEALPGVASAAVKGQAPYVMALAHFNRPGEEQTFVTGAVGTVTPRYLRTGGFTLVAGDPPAEDWGDGVVVNRILADALWPGGDPLGQSVIIFDEPKQVIGVVAHDRCSGFPSDPVPCAWQRFGMGRLHGTLYVRTTVPPMSLAPTLARVVRDLDPDVALSEVQTLEEVADRLSEASRAAALTTAVLALFGVLLLCVGCLTLFLSMVKDSVREIAVRVALGVSNAALTRRIVLQGFFLALAGVLLGVATARVVALRLTDQLYRVAPTDTLTFVALPLVVTGLALASIYVAAVRATKTEPARYLRRE